MLNFPVLGDEGDEGDEGDPNVAIESRVWKVCSSMGKGVYFPVHSSSSLSIVINVSISWRNTSGAFSNRAIEWG